MTLAFRPLIVVLLLSLAASSALAKKTPALPALPMAPPACVDFYAHVNFDWLLAHPLPIGAPSFSRWDELNASAAQKTRDLLGNPGPVSAGPASGLLADLAASAQDAASLDAAAHATAQPLLAQIDAMRKPKDVVKVIAALNAAGIPVALGFDALRDPGTGQPQATFYPDGLGLPDPTYYSSPDPELRQAMVVYQAYLTELLRFSGVDEAKLGQQAGWALATEQALASAMGPATSQAIAIAELGKSYPALSLPAFVQAQGVAPTMVNVQQPGYFQVLEQMLVKPSVPQWQAYLRVRVADSLAQTMARDPRQPYLAALNVLPEPTAVVAASDRLAALARLEAFQIVSSAYAETYLSPADQQRANAIAESIRAAMERAIERATWLSADGKSAAKSELAAMRLAIGQPILPVSFAGLSLDRHNYAANVLALRRWNRARSLALLNSPVWPWPLSQTQPVIGYQAGENRLIATAAVLSAPAFEGKSAASDYGSFGALLAQQMSLAFADLPGNDGSALAMRQAGLVAQYDAYAATAAMPADGARVQRQNAADLTAIEIAWDAFTAQGAPDASSAQAFFTAWAATWARQDGPAAFSATEMQMSFAPARWRVNGPLINSPAFTQAFSCKAGQPMYKNAKDQLAIWR